MSIEIPNTAISHKSVQLVKLSRLEIDQIRDMNILLFEEDRIINRYDHEHMIILMLKVNSLRAGFKIGYNLDEKTFYSAKGGVLPAYRRQGFARNMLREMMKDAQKLGFESFAYDTFPNIYPEMLILGLQEGFKVTDSEWNTHQHDFKLRLNVSISEYLFRIDNPGQTDF